MSDITELESRISTALERIGKGAKALAEARTTQAPETIEPSKDAADPAEITRLKEALDEEKLANAQLEERVKVLHDRQEKVMGQTEERAKTAEARLAEVEKELATFRRLNDELRASNAALRDANAEGVGDAHLINKSMRTELESLRTAHNADRKELETLLEELKPLVKEASNA